MRVDVRLGALEPIGVTVFSAVMAMSSLQIIAEAVKRFVAIVTSGDPGLDVGPLTYAILGATIAAKWSGNCTARTTATTPTALVTTSLRWSCA